MHIWSPCIRRMVSMLHLSIKNLVIFALIIGIVAGVGAGIVKSAVDNSPVAVASGDSEPSDQINPWAADHELSQLTGEHDPTWLLELALGGFQGQHSGSSSNPEELRARIEALGIEVPEGASTHDLQNLLSGRSGAGGGFDHSGQ